PGVAPRRRARPGSPHGFGHAADGLLIALGRARESGFDDVHAQRVELEGEAQLRLRRHGIAWRLLAIPQRGVEDADVSLHGDRSVPFRISGVKKEPRTLGVRGAGTALLSRYLLTSCFRAPPTPPEQECSAAGPAAAGREPARTASRVCGSECQVLAC